ncbi:pyridoxal 5'-phosphate synthase [Streptacidiphilus sp. EB129]|uniref:pyridoxine/pyridoxamine 5'-phosphate oxidase n=1 Tax=Streptacidiphilus sp. EB129 TaxID=3156262 RepID=UPI003517723C
MPTSPVPRLILGLPMLRGEFPGFDSAAAPAEPFALFLAWLAEAVATGVREPHAMTLATVDPEGCPDLRVVALRDAGEGGWTFATGAHSAKALQLAAQPQGALGFHWREQGRQIRLRGPVRREDAATAAVDFLARPPASRAASLMGHQSEPLADRALLPAAFAAAEARIAEEPELVDPEHALFTLRPESVEFWQGDPGRGHTRLLYRRTPTAWTRTLLWP